MTSPREFIVETKNPADAVRFVRITASRLPGRTGKPDHGNTKYDLRNLVIVFALRLKCWALPSLFSFGFIYFSAIPVIAQCPCK